MSFNKLLLFSFLILFTSCSGQENTGKSNTTVSDKSSPTIIRNFKAIAVPPDFDTTLVSQYIRSIFQDSKGNLWFGTLGEGVVRYDPGTYIDSAQHKSLRSSVKTLTYFSDPDGFVSTTVYAINEDQHGNLWLGTDQGVYKYDGETFRNYNQQDGLSHLDITRKGILVDKSGAIWVGTHHGVFRYDPSADDRGEQSFSLFQELPTINVTGIMEDRSGNIWFASSENGVFRYDGKTITNIAEKEGLGDNYAGGMAQDKAGNMWFVSKNGICKFDPSAYLDSIQHKSLKTGREVFKEYTAKDGLGGTEFVGIYIEESGIIWITARGNTTRFDPSIDVSNPNAFTVFTPKDGLNCCVQSMYQDRSGNMWWGAGQGLYRFDGKRFFQVKKNGPW